MILVSFEPTCLTPLSFFYFHLLEARSLLNSTAAMDVPVLYAPTAFDNASLSVLEVNLSPETTNCCEIIFVSSTLRVYLHLAVF